MNKGWQSSKLGDLCEVFADGDWVESKDQASEGIRLIQTGKASHAGEGFRKKSQKFRPAPPRRLSKKTHFPVKSQVPQVKVSAESLPNHPI
jgi:hypothetical protein